MKEEIKVLISEKEITKKVKEIATQINKDYEGKEVFLLCILKGSVFFTCELSKYLTVPVKMGFMSASSYGDGLTSSGVVRINQDEEINVKGKHVIVIEDIVDSGRTLAFLMHMLAKREPASMRLCALLDKPSGRVSDVNADYTGFKIPDKYVVGYGMDYAQRYRNLPYVGELIFKEGEE
ncbi:MAG: hypoxanthine phosphoribosyltransferase [Eubacterium sp.]